MHEIGMSHNNPRNPIFWVPSVYFAMGLPFIAVNLVSTFMFKDLGISDRQIAFWTSVIMMPWTLKFLWSPFLEMYRTKKFFVIITQFKGDVLAVNAAFHLKDVFGADVEFVGNHLGLAFVQPVQAFFHAAQVEEEFALRLGGGDFDHAPVADDVFVDFAFNPVDGEGDKADATLRLEAFDGFHQADVAFLDEIAERQTIAGEAACDVNDKFEVVHDEGLRGVDVVGFLQGDGEFAFFFGIQRRDLANFGDVLVDVGAGG